MKRRLFLQSAGIGAVAVSSCASVKRKKHFSFVHFSDIHVQPESGAREGFLAAIEKMNSLKPDFAVSGGDLVMDVLRADEQRAVTLYDLYKECCQKFDMPVYNVMGNHEVFGLYVPEKVPENHPEWGKEMFKKRVGEGKTYRSFAHKDVHFMLLDSIGYEKNPDKPGYQYFGQIGEEQMGWLKGEINALPSSAPVIAVAHIPYFTYYPQISNGPMTPNDRGSVITDGKELLETLNTRRLFGFLEGHIHVNEVMIYKNTHLVDTAAVSGGWWAGPRDGHPEGFNLVHVHDDGIETEYITYGWDASKYKKPALNPDVFPLVKNA